MLGFFKRFFDSNKREIARLSALVERINNIEPELEALSDTELKAKTGEFKQRLNGRA